VFPRDFKLDDGSEKPSIASDFRVRQSVCTSRQIGTLREARAWRLLATIDP